MTHEERMRKSLDLHAEYRGKIRMESIIPITSKEDLALVYTPGVGGVSSEIARNPDRAHELTWRGNTVAVVSDGSAVLGLGNIGPDAALPVMEGKCAIFKQFADIDAVPIVLGTQDTEEIITAVKAMAPSFGAIQLEDISAPRCFEIEERLQEALNIPVMHDDQHGTAIVVVAGLMNALKVVGKRAEDIRVVMNGAGAAGTAIVHLLQAYGVGLVIVCDRKGALYEGRDELNEEKKKLALITNKEKRAGSLADVARDADVLIGVSSANAFSKDLIASLAPQSIVFALANPVPEILPSEAHEAGARVVATGRSDFPNQVNNALCYPGLFRGMLDTGVQKVTLAMKLSASRALAGCVAEPTAENIIPDIFDKGLVEKIAGSVSASG